jgi:hypothetical protein
MIPKIWTDKKLFTFFESSQMEYEMSEEEYYLRKVT